jgi:hypothetical protein
MIVGARFLLFYPQLIIIRLQIPIIAPVIPANNCISLTSRRINHLRDIGLVGGRHL